ncbi:GroES-like protein [Massarina eburnea CBS 473.64]|uniref:GroES-like protein n=1 Tax=Massarina eburnea CBS 473.64 TaxID=1395130 RepID=A0A6A6S492_9PLEO|nr:GroES-like protein [Massarina eburnea CBS 473.64]
MLTTGAGEIVVKNSAIAINQPGLHMQNVGVFVEQWPAVFGCEVTGKVYKVGLDVQRFKKGGRVIRHTANLVSGRPEDSAFAHYTVVPADKAAILPDSIPLLMASRFCSRSKTLVTYGGSSIGSMVTQVATAAGIRVISIRGAHKLDSNNLACTHSPLAGSPDNVTAGTIFAVNDIATPVWKDFVTPALEAGKLQCLPPPTVVSRGVDCIQDALAQSKAGVSANKRVVEL